MAEAFLDRTNMDQRIQSILRRLNNLENAHSDEVKVIIESVNEMYAELQISDKKAIAYESRVNNILDALLKYTLMDFSRPAEVSEIGDELDAIALGVNTLAEELQDKIVEERLNAGRLHEQNLKLERVNKELSSFAYVSSHDLQEPLRKINTYISRILDEDLAGIPEEIRFYLDRIRSSAVRMQKLIRDILEYSKLSIGEDEVKSVELSVLAGEVKDDFDETFREAGATFIFSLDCEVRVVPFQFKQLLTNLIGNSIKFRNKDRPLKISLTNGTEPPPNHKKLKLSSSRKFCHLRYTDNGIGFSSVYNEKIFEVFQRLHSQSDYQGTGVGLAICKRIAENHGGAIAATGDEGKGATFDIYLPY